MTDNSKPIQVKLVKIGNSTRMTIPRPIAWALGLKAGDYVEVNVDDGCIIVKKSVKKSAA